nr:hypothetical protein [Tanacetum cinerariifolium]
MCLCYQNPAGISLNSHWSNTLSHGLAINTLEREFWPKFSGIKCTRHSLLVRKFPLPEGTSYCLKKNATARRKVLPLPKVCTAIIVKEKPPLLATPRPGFEVRESSATAARWLGPTMAYGVDCSYVKTRIRDTKRRMMAALELVNLRVSYQEQEGIQTREALARSEAHCRALEARVAVLETHTRRLEWQCQAADDVAVQHIMRTQALEARARDDTLEDTEVKKLEIKLWNQKVRDNDIPAYTNRFQELALICTKFVSNETEKKLCTYAKRKSDSKRKADDIPRNNQQPFKRQNVIKAYNLGSAEKKNYKGNAP